MKHNDQHTSESDIRPRFGIRWVIGCVAICLLPGLAFYGSALGLGLWHDPIVSIKVLVAGICATYLLFCVIMVMGESVIEDAVKFIFFGIACAVSWGKFEANIQALMLAVPLGSGLPIVVRLVTQTSPSQSGD
jgi:hypothetical protein